jgi:hypothetical protein
MNLLENYEKVKNLQEQQEKIENEIEIRKDINNILNDILEGKKETSFWEKEVAEKLNIKKYKKGFVHTFCGTRNKYKTKITKILIKNIENYYKGE